MADMQRTEDDDEVVQRILNSVAQCFRNTGLRKTSMLDIAEAAGAVGRPSTAASANKEAIIESLFQQGRVMVAPRSVS